MAHIEAEPDRRAGETRRYGAFISYSRQDAAFVKRLHWRLEGYRLPRRLRAGGDGRLKPIFRDDDDLGAAADLSDAVREALEQSDHLIVVCSPSAARSIWVAREIELFRTLRGGGAILAALIEGEPDAAFPPTLLRPDSRDGHEPLAADFRPQAPGRRLAMLKLIAGLTGAPLDELIQRHAQRQVRQIAALAGGTALTAVVVAALAVGALTAELKGEAERRRAEGLGAFMLNDLLKPLRAAGRLDLRTAVNKAALSSLNTRDLGRLSADELVQRSTALQALGEDDEKRGDLAGAQQAFADALKTTGVLLAGAPNDPKRIFANAQSQYWMGFIDWRKNDPSGARSWLSAYAASAYRLYRADPAKPDWQDEVAEAELNLGTLALRQYGDAAGAEGHFKLALQRLGILSAAKPSDPDRKRDLADAYGWLADSQRLQGQGGEALQSRLDERALIDQLAQQDPRDLEIRSDRLGNELALARIEADRGQLAAALSRLGQARAAAVALMAQAPENGDLSKQARVLELFRLRTLMDQYGRRRASAIARELGGCRPRSAAENEPELHAFCLALDTRALMQAGATSDASALAVQLKTLGQSGAYSRRWGLNFAEEMRRNPPPTRRS